MELLGGGFGRGILKIGQKRWAVSLDWQNMKLCGLASIGNFCRLGAGADWLACSRSKVLSIATRQGSKILACRSQKTTA